MSCLPNYNFIPNDPPSRATRTAPSYNKHRSRVTVIDDSYSPPTSTEDQNTVGEGIGGEPPTIEDHGIFVRSKEQTTAANNISIEQTLTKFIVRFDNQIVEEYEISPFATISSLRSKLSSSNYIEMPEFQFDIYDIVRTIEDDQYGKLFEFGETALVGGEGPPSDGPLNHNIKTGTSRALVIVQSMEDVTGRTVDSHPSERVLQWNGEYWISYQNANQGQCPLDGIL